MFVISLVIMAVLVAADQLIKLAVTNNLPLNGQPVEVIKFGSFKVFSLTHIRNTGAAWSMMSGKTWFLIGLPVVVLIVAVIYMYKIRKGGACVAGYGACRRYRQPYRQNKGKRSCGLYQVRAYQFPYFQLCGYLYRYRRNLVRHLFLLFGRKEKADP